MNYILLKNGLPPVIIKSSDKKNYLLALNKADVGDLNAFNEYIAKQLVWSLELSIKAANGEDIEEEDDIDKEIAVLKKTLKKEDDIKEKKSKANIDDALLKSFIPLVKKIQSKIIQFDDLFYEINHTYYINDFAIPNESSKLPQLEIKAFVFDLLHTSELSLLNDSEDVKNFQKEVLGVNKTLIDLFKINFSWKGFKKDKFNTFSVDKWLFFRFSEFYYTIEIENRNKFKIEKLYSENLTDTEINNIVNELCKIILEEIRQHVKK
jgi:hypothetical protein